MTRLSWSNSLFLFLNIDLFCVLFSTLLVSQTNKRPPFYSQIHSTNNWNDCLIKVLQSTVFYKSYSPLSVSLSSLSNEFQLANNFHHIRLVTAFLSHLLVIKWIDFCSLWVINPTGLERLQRGSHRETFLMDSHRKTFIHRANEIGLQDWGFRERENSQEETHVQWDET